MTRAEDLCDLSKGILCESFEQDRRLTHPCDDDFYFLQSWTIRDSRYVIYHHPNFPQLFLPEEANAVVTTTMAAHFWISGASSSL